MGTGYIMLDTPRPDPQQGTYPRRGGYRPSGTIIVHTTEGDWRRGVQALINLVLGRIDYGCYHRGCDWADIALLYPWEWETWQDSETNNWAVGIAAACKTTDWGNMPADVEEGFYRNMGRMAADFVAYMRDEYGVTVPLKRISGAQARAGVPGFCAHGDSGVARSDPGANFNWGRFFQYTEEALNKITNQGTITPIEEDDLAFTISDLLNHPAYDGGPTVSQVLKNLDDSEVTRYVKGDKDATLYDLTDDGALRPITFVEWQVTGRPYRTLPQAVIDALLKVA